MESKICKQCGSEKELSGFRLSHDGYYNNTCKVCMAINVTANKRTKRGVAQTLYKGQVGSSKKRNHIPPTYTEQELYEWLMSQDKFHILYDNWKRLDYQKDYKPSVDRKDDYVGYTMANIQLMTWRENYRKFHSDKKGGINNKASVSVSQFTMNGEFVATHPSTCYAGRIIEGACQQDICKCCNPELSRKSSGEYLWQYGSDKQYIGELPSKSKRCIVQQIDKDSGVVLNEYKNLASVVKDTGFAYGTIHRCCKTNKGTANGFKWQYKIDKDK